MTVTSFAQNRFKRVVYSLLLVLLFTAFNSNAQTAEKPFRLPMQDAPGANTWLLGQPYGNTIGAFLRGDEWYSAGQRLHFGLDFSMPCNTPLVAIGDGEVIFVDNLGFGSAPHNLLIRHDAGFVSLYGHLSGRAPVAVGQRVTAGELVAYSGDPDLTCTSRPHLHFELRSLDYGTTYNPVEYINANWDMLASIGSFRYPVFQQDLDNVRRWTQLDDQPIVTFGGQALNRYAAPYPDYRAGQPLDNPPLLNTAAPLGETAIATLRKLGTPGCCVGSKWHPTNASWLYGLDGATNQRASIFRWNVAANDAIEPIGQAPQPFTSADGTHVISRLNDSEFRIQQLGDDGSTIVAEFGVNTGGAFPSLSADNSKIVFLVQPEDDNPDAPTSLWVADKDGSNARVLLADNGVSARWLDANRLLVSRREEQVTRLEILDTTNDSGFIIGEWQRLRGMSIAPGGGRLMFYVSNQPDPMLSGVYTVETTQGAILQQMRWFGAWLWRDADSVFYLPFNPISAVHTLHHYDLVSGTDRPLTDPTTQAFAVGNGDWSVSADGSTIAFWNALDDATWVIGVE